MIELYNSDKYYNPFLAVQNRQKEIRAKRLIQENQAKRQFQEKILEKEFFLIRLDTNEKIFLNKTVFRMGRATDTCDYAILNNNYIGRSHAQIIIENGQAFFVDNNSTNKSFINNTMVSPNQKVLLRNNDLISLANISFRFISN